MRPDIVSVSLALLACPEYGSARVAPPQSSGTPESTGDPQDSEPRVAGSQAAPAPMGTSLGTSGLATSSCALLIEHLSPALKEGKKKNKFKFVLGHTIHKDLQGGGEMEWAGGGGAFAL